MRFIPAVRIWIVAAGYLALASCAATPETTAPSSDPLLYSERAVAAADRLVVFVPGALASVRMFDSAAGWTDGGFAAVYYRFPGLDGFPLTGPLAPEQAADQIAAFANAYPDKDVALVGYSSGAPIALMAASRIAGDRVVPVAAVAPLVERAGGLPTVVRGAGDLLRASIRAGSIDLTLVWIEYWHILLYGRDTEPDPAFREQVFEFAQEHRGDRRFGPPDSDLARAHSRALRAWEIPEDLDLSNVRLRIYAGLEDPVFSTAQTLRFARRLGVSEIYGYPGDGHLLYLTQPDVFDTAQRFAIDTFEDD